MAELWFGYVWPLIWIVIKIVLIVAPLLLSVAYLTLAERKVIGAMHLRRGPNVVGPWGLLQPIADGMKLFFKETVIPTGTNRAVFILAPCVTFVLALIAWAVIPFGPGLVLADINVGILYLFAISSLGVYGILMAGWASNSRYAFLGALRSAAQMVSYEVAMGFIIITVLICAGSLNLSAIVAAQKNLWFVVPLFPMAVIFFISTLAETNRHPFDLPEAENELVAGFNVEYSAMIFALFFLGEYANMILMAGITTILFLGGWLPPADWALFTWIPGPVWFALKMALLLFVFLWVRATFPRYRYDQLMRLGWKVFLPISLAAVVVVGGVVVAFDLQPVLR
ncbi:MAG: NADH-quinone oxidoreductase subunit NuoH [Rhodospirillales bacterium]|nr:NADH-quinone oxidoreductase subunit NuoH [Rhodospirillales bacterium]